MSTDYKIELLYNWLQNQKRWLIYLLFIGIPFVLFLIYVFIAEIIIFQNYFLYNNETGKYIVNPKFDEFTYIYSFAAVLVMSNFSSILIGRLVKKSKYAKLYLIHFTTSTISFILYPLMIFLMYYRIFNF